MIYDINSPADAQKVGEFFRTMAATVDRPLREKRPWFRCLIGRSQAFRSRQYESPNSKLDS
jgi:hypothetical protein